MPASGLSLHELTNDKLLFSSGIYLISLDITPPTSKFHPKPTQEGCMSALKPEEW